MLLLILGLALWAFVHSLPTFGVKLRGKLIAKAGIIKYKLAFALLIISSIVLMVMGWKSTQPLLLYLHPGWMQHIALGLVFITSVLMAAAQMKTNIKRILRHPQLTGVLLWSAGHLLVNGDTRSLILFTGIALWAGLMMIGANIRDGAWEKPVPVSIKYDLLVLTGGIFLFIVLFLAHPYLSGVSLAARLPL